MADTHVTIYFAGFFDGEGCVAIYPKKYVVSLTNTDIRPLLQAKELWGGSIATQTASARPGAIQDLWRWQIYGHNSRRFLEDIRPYVVVKGEQIDAYLSALVVVPSSRGQKREVGASHIIESNANKLRLLKRGLAHG